MQIGRLRLSGLVIMYSLSVAVSKATNLETWAERVLNLLKRELGRSVRWVDHHRRGSL